MEDIKECLVYCRVSSPNQRNNGVSLEAQEEACRQYCKTRGIRVKNIIYETASAVTGQKQLMLKFFLDNYEGPMYLIVYSVSRFSRSVVSGLDLARKFREKDIHIRSVTESIELDTAGGEFNFTSLLNACELEAKLISQRVKQSLDYKKSLGSKLGKAPFGKRGYIDKSTGIRSFERQDREEAILRFVSLARTPGSTVQDLNDTMSQISNHVDRNPIEFSDRKRTLRYKLGWKNIAQLLNDYGVKPRNQEAKWTMGSVYSLKRHFKS